MEPASSDGAQIVDQDGNIIPVTLAQLEEAGVDVDNLAAMTDAQLQHVLALAADASNSMGSSSKDKVEAGVAEFEGGTEAAHDSLTLIIADDGSLKLKNPDGQTYQLDVDSLLALGIDANKLTDDHVQLIVQMAEQSFQQHNTINSTNNTTVDEPVAESSSSKVLPKKYPTRHSAYRGRRGILGKHAATSQSPDGTNGWIGKDVYVKKPSGAQAAVVKYYRHPQGYKVQFADGHFEWVSNDKLLLKTSDADDVAESHESLDKRMTDHQGYNQSTSVRQPVPPVPLVKVNSDEPSRKRVQLDRPPNFCCPVCEKNVYQKEPAYIVIRLPACDTCADSNILLLDEPNSSDDSRNKQHNMCSAKQTGAEEAGPPQIDHIAPAHMEHGGVFNPS